jgi:hypothetical protein
MKAKPRARAIFSLINWTEAKEQEGEQKGDRGKGGERGVIELKSMVR